MKKPGAAELRAREKFLLEVTSLPVAAGHEGAAAALVAGWVGRRPKLALTKDACGNLVVTRKDFKAACRRTAPLFITAHLDHPAFVALAVSGREVKLEFRGGVQDAYFKGAALELFDAELKQSYPAKITALDSGAKPFKTVTARLAAPAPVAPGCLGRWQFPPAEVKDGVAYTHACDDLASVAAALTAFEIISRDKKLGHAALLFTRAEEVGFVGAIGAARSGTIPKNARLICLECSRSFPHDSPIGAGPIVRVGDRMSVFTPELTNLVSDAAAAYQKENPAFKFQRKLMPGGVCEASAFSFYGLRSTCLCLALGNYHNMADLDGVARGKKARPGREYVAVADYHGLVELLCVVAKKLDAPRPSPRQVMERRWADLAFVVGR
ncbi:MAG: hypothetical protein A2X32_04340 [Elusimicrobia bacterium GWC2_64_44]|nr:MAG: hypothetical protein A2X32_04340 [Elusimicrobia bacterium GWC2_64_44]